jgi:outer membrane protein OmpA-like peptidoglycan-associated protein
MGFDYNKQKNHGGQDSMWTSYSDLFLGLSIIFLLLYVSASLKQSTDGIRQHMDLQRISKENEDLKQQIQVYNTLKQDYLTKEASQDEQSTYEELMNKLSLLQEDAKDEKNKLQKQALENEKKEHALSKYQQMVRNIINSNMLAKARIKSRDTMIENKDVIIDEKSNEIKGLETTVAEKKAKIEQGENHIAGLESELQKRMSQLRNSYKSQKISKKKFEQQQNLLRQETENKIGALRDQNQKFEKELSQAAQELQQTSTQLSETKNENTKLQGRVAGMRAEFAAQSAKERAAFDAQLAKERLSGEAKAAREAAFKAEAQRKAGALEGQIADLDRKYKTSQGELAKAQENLNARKKLASQIKGNFRAKGIKAEVDAGTGDVLLSFGDEYFDTGQSSLKPGMRKILEQAMPTYSESLFKTPQIADKIQSVEIVGFASPTFKGKYVDPSHLNPETRQAVNYNLDLSYARARSIFNYVFDKEKISFKYQEHLLPLVKVTGRSFLSSEKERDIASQKSGTDSFCSKNDCAKLQRVIIKFTLKD